MAKVSEEVSNKTWIFNLLYHYGIISAIHISIRSV